MGNVTRRIGICAAALLVVCILCRLLWFRDYTFYAPLPEAAEESLQKNGAQIVPDQPEVVSAGDARFVSGYLQIPVYPEGRGEVELEVRDGSGETWGNYYFRVGPFQTVYDMQTGGFTGDSVVMIAVCLFWLAVSIIMLRCYFQSKGAAYYSYSTIFSIGFSIFALVAGLVMVYTATRHFLDPVRFGMYSVYGAINGVSRHFMMLTAPLVLAFAVAVAVSNIALLRHAGFRRRNVLGIAVALLLILGECIGWYWFLMNFSGSELEYRLSMTAQNVYATVFVYFECMLAGAVICGLCAARHRPAFDKDFIVILGCWFRPDGSLPPLLRGRVDRAIEFWREQKQVTGKEAVFIPSGGQGRDEPMAEGEAMRRYLLEQGFPESAVRPETQSANTYQNMVYSREIIDAADPNAKTVFSTTNYHVFRSGVWAAQAGLRAEGIGSRTKWWFWPNAFLRECAGLMVRRWKQELLLLAGMIAFFGLLSMVLGE